ncbi:hypothetical protein F4604DRAFT_1883848 [Suillus subluteus]|nr:hypothetical protein F4604DRAFT_1883848 [Suillus subluteus]
MSIYHYTFLSHCKHGPGVFGHCEAYYGTVETQGRGTLHCHMLLWIAGNPSPQELHNKMAADDNFKENIINCELLYDKAKEDMDPHLEKQLQLVEMDEQSFQHKFMDFLNQLAVECNWHVHNDTCYKHLRHGEKRGDTNCRMRLDGKLQEMTETGSIELCQWHGLGEAAKATGDVLMYIGLQMHETKYSEAKDGNDTNIVCQETSHQQVMSYLVGGGDHYTSHTFQVVKYRASQGEHNEVDDDDESMHLEESISVDISTENMEFTSDIQDYTCCPHD